MNTSANKGMHLFRVDGKLAVVTGGADGIGLACAQLLLEAGARVVALDRSPVSPEVLQTSGPRMRSYLLDVTDELAVTEAFATVARDHGPIDILVNSAGIAIRKPTLELDLAAWNAVVAVNMTGLFLCAREGVRHMPQAGGSMVNVASVMGLSGGGLYPNLSYQTTKGGVVNMTRALAVEFASRGIRVNAVAPTWTRTKFIGPLLESADLMAKIRAATPLGRLAEPEEVAAAVLFLASPAAAMVTGHTLPVDGGFLAQ